MSVKYVVLKFRFGQEEVCLAVAPFPLRCVPDRITLLILYFNKEVFFCALMLEETTL